MLIVTLNVLNIMFGKCHPVPFGLISFIVAVVMTFWVFIITVEKRITEYKTMEYRVYPTCVEVVVDGKKSYILSKRSEMYEMVVKHGIDHIVRVESLNLFGVDLENNLTIRTDKPTKTTIYNFLVPSDFADVSRGVDPDMFKMKQE